MDEIQGIVDQIYPVKDRSDIKMSVVIFFSEWTKFTSREPDLTPLTVVPTVLLPTVP